MDHLIESPIPQEIPTTIPSVLPWPPKPIVRDAHEPNMHVPQTKEREMTSPKYPASLIVAQALSRLLPCNQPGRKELISPQWSLLLRDGGGGDEESKI